VSAAANSPMLSGPFLPGSDFSRFAVSTYGFIGRKSLRGKKFSGKPAALTPRFFFRSSERTIGYIC
jgi:hypothetical protein